MPPSAAIDRRVASGTRARAGTAATISLPSIIAVASHLVAVDEIRYRVVESDEHVVDDVAIHGAAQLERERVDGQIGEECVEQLRGTRRWEEVLADARQTAPVEHVVEDVHGRRQTGQDHEWLLAMSVARDLDEILQHVAREHFHVFDDQHGLFRWSAVAILVEGGERVAERIRQVHGRL